MAGWFPNATVERLGLVAVSALAVCVLVPGVVSVAGADTATAGSQSIESGFTQDIDADAVVLAADIRANGDADWRVTYRLDLDTDERETAFEELRADIEDDPDAYLDPFEERMRTTAATARETTDREMTVGGFAVETDRETQPQGEFGFVTFRFEWTGFAAVAGDTILAGDALDRLILGEDERLQLGWPDGYRLQSSAPEPDSVEQHRAVWRGPVDFDTGQPRLELVAEDDPDTGFALLVFGALGVVFVVAVVVWRRRRRSARRTPDAGDAGGVPTGTAPPGDPDGSDDADDADGSGDASNTDGSDDADDAETGPPPELLSNEERLLQLLEANGGRMKQQAVAEQLDWTAAKTSQVVSDLREAGNIESFRLGRENVLTLPDVDIVGGADDDDDESERDDPPG